jgi:hypothetical protein
MAKIKEILEAGKSILIVPRTGHVGIYKTVCTKDENSCGLICKQSNPQCEGEVEKIGHFSSTAKAWTTTKIYPNKQYEVGANNFSGKKK